MYDFSRVAVDNTSNGLHARLLAEVFEKPDLFTSEFIKWQYADNPAGCIVGFNALAGDVIAAHYVAQPFYATLNGQKCKGLLSLNTATDINHRGKGLFTKLAEQTYSAAASEGYDFVIGVANQNSVHGFIKKLGFQLVGQLLAKLGFGAVPAIKESIPVYYQRDWDPESLSWRLANPSARYHSLNRKGTRTVFAKTHAPFIKAHLIAVDEAQLQQELAKQPFSPLTLYIGIDAGIDFKRRAFVDVPTRFRSSPLNLIFKPLQRSAERLDYGTIRFQLIDFDAY
jgi:GNAT superfamily N-acetyltransferase